MKDYKYIDYRVDNRVAIITINKPGQISTQSKGSVAEWVDAVNRANNDKFVGAIIFTATGKGFCAGGDMKKLFLPKNSGEESYEENDDFTGGLGLLAVDWVKLLRDSKPVIVAFNGFTVGGGVTFFLPADVLITAESASFHFSFVKVGIVAEVCSTKYLPARVGFGRASEIILSGRTVSSQEAEKIGLVDYRVADEQLMNKAMEVATQIASNPAPMLRMNKQLLDQNVLEPDNSVIWKRESDALRSCFSMDEHKQAINRFLEKSSS